MNAPVASPTNPEAPPMTIVVTTDGSDHAMRAIGPAQRLADLAGASMAIAVGDPARDGATREQSGDETVCFATRWFGRFGALQRVATLGAPALCVGPRVQDPPWHPRHGVLVCVDGNPESERALLPARRWAARLHQPITLVTVTAERPPGPEQADHRVHFGPLDPVGYLGDLVDELGAGGTTASAVVLTDELSPASALRRYLREDRSALVVAATSSRSNLRAVLLRSVAAMVVDNSRVPVLLIPPVGGALA